MKKLIDIFLDLTFFVISIILLLYNMLIRSDIPVNISKNDFIGMLISFILFAVLYSLYIKKCRTKEIVILSFLPLVFWSVDITAAIKYNHSLYSTILSIIGFITTVYYVGLSIYKFKTTN